MESNVIYLGVICSLKWPLELSPCHLLLAIPLFLANTQWVKIDSFIQKLPVWKNSACIFGRIHHWNVFSKNINSYTSEGAWQSQEPLGWVASTYDTKFWSIVPLILSAYTFCHSETYSVLNIAVKYAQFCLHIPSVCSESMVCSILQCSTPNSVCIYPLL